MRETYHIQAVAPELSKRVQIMLQVKYSGEGKQKTTHPVSALRDLLEEGVSHLLLWNQWEVP